MKPTNGSLWYYDDELTNSLMPKEKAIIEFKITGKDIYYKVIISNKEHTSEFEKTTFHEFNFWNKMNWIKQIKPEEITTYTLMIRVS